MSDSIAKLAKTLNKRMHTVSSGKVDVVAEIGEMIGTSLQLASVDGKIPKSQYTVLQTTIKLDKDVPVTVTGGGHSHTAKIEAGTKISGELSLSSGDTVLVIWASEEPVIVGRID